MIKNVVFGDTGGHASQLFASLEALGVDLDTYTIPENLRIIHLGDIIHKGPASSVLIEIINLLMTNNKGRWIQILGNHESQHLRPDAPDTDRAPYFWSCDCKERDKKKLNYWWKTGMASFAWGLDSFDASSLKLEVSQKPKIVIPDKGILFTHGGLTNVFWTAVTDKQKIPSAVAKKLNASALDLVSQPGQLLGVFNRFVGPVWAIGNTEVFPDWYMATLNKQEEMPFIQMHGHTQSFNFVRQKWFPVSKAFRDQTKLNPITRAVVTEVSNSLLIGLDPGFSTKADIQDQPFIVFESNK